ncbi:MAG: zinc transporter ZupT [Clostridiales bacterium]|nr:zinc transporter ZupT [Clostridiales bacterium]
MTGNVWLAFGLTAIAGLSTGIGSAIALFAKKTNTNFLSLSLGFSAGVMIYVSMIEIFQEAQNALKLAMGNRYGAIVTVAAFFGGMLIIGIIDKLIPKKNNPHEFCSSSGILEENECTKKKSDKKLMRTGLFTALAIAIHNFPEGIATFVTALQGPTLAIPIVIAIALHNIPEGVAVAMPIYHATGSKKKAFFYSFASGLSEPLGALVAYLILMPFLNDILFGVIFAAVAGIMVFISFDELLPAAREYGKHHLSILGLISGMAIMAVSLLLFM